MPSTRLRHPEYFALLAMLLAAAIIALSDARTQTIITNTVILTTAVCAIALPLGTMLAFLLVRTNMPWRRSLAVIVGMLLFVPLYLQAAGWEAGFGLQGAFSPPRGAVLITGWRGTIWIHAMAAVPWVVLIVGGALRFVESELEESALLDAPAWRVLATVTARRAAGGILVAAAWIAIAAAGEMTVTNLFQVRTYAEELYTELAIGEEPARVVLSTLPAAIVSGLLAATALAVMVRHVPARTQTGARPVWVIELGPAGRTLALLTAAAIAILLVVVPLVDLVYQAGVIVSGPPGLRVRRWSAAKCVSMVIDSPWRFRDEFFWSFVLSTTAALGALVFAVPIAWWARQHQAWTIVLIIALACVLALPSPVIGMSIIWLLNRPGAPLLNWLYDDTIFAPWMALTLRAWPLATLIVWQAFRTCARTTRSMQPRSMG